MNNLETVIERVARVRSTKETQRSRGVGQSPTLTFEELHSEAWLYANDPTRAKWIQHEVENTHRPSGARYTSGEQRLAKMIDAHLMDTLRAVRNGGDTRKYIMSDDDPSVIQRRTPVHASLEDDVARVGGFHAETFPEAMMDCPEDSAWERREDGTRIYGFAQDPNRPVGMLAYAREKGLISDSQEEMLKSLMEGDAPGDFYARHPEGREASLRKSLSVALSSLRKDELFQIWAGDYGFDPLSEKGRSFTSQHRHDDGEAEGPRKPSYPFQCDCDRMMGYDEDAPDKADPLAHPVPKHMRRDSGQSAPWAQPMAVVADAYDEL